LLYGYLKYLLSYFVDLLFFSGRNKNLFTQAEKVKEILVINTGHIGELVLTSAFLANIRKIFPIARITLMAGDWALPVLENSSLVDKTIVYNSNPYNRERKKRLSFRQSLTFILDLMKKDFDLILDLRSDYWIMLYSIICGVKYRIDFGAFRVKKHLKKHFSKSHHGLTKLRHYGLQYLDMLDEIYPLTEKDKTLYLEVDDEANRWIKNRLMDFDINSHDFVAIIHPFAEWKGREWGIDKFAAVADYCAYHYGAKIIVTGTKENKERSADMISHMSSSACDLVGATTLKTFMALISRADVFICNDGGHMHIAAALKRPLVALFGPQTPLLFAPWSKNSKVVYHQMDCSPCKQKHCTKKPSCMEIIKVGEVIKEVEKLCKTS
jgi:heptosyltransferase-2